ncbi:MAG: hypothetical protein AAFU85_28680 [Planctomycetota bacterium]
MRAHSANSTVTTETHAAEEPSASAQASSASDSRRMLEEVLGETLLRRQESVGELRRVLLEFRDRLGREELVEDDFPLLIREVLGCRLSKQAKRLPDDLFQEVGGALWSHEPSRQRVFQLWHSLEAVR